MKYVISEVKYLVNSQLSHLKDQVQEIYSELSKNGYVVVTDFIPQEKCLELQNELDFHLEKKYAWNDSKGSDSRIYAIERVSDAFKNIYSIEMLSKIYKKHIDKFKIYEFTMANRVQYKDDNLGSGGGWHRDVINRRQLKFITYINDADEENGCFQYIPGTHTVTEKYKTNRDMGLGSGVYRYTQENIDKLLNETDRICVNLSGKKGTLIIVDTSGIHRGSPITKPGAIRYAATQYMSDSPFRKHITKYFAPEYSHDPDVIATMI